MILTYRQCLEKYGTDYRIKKAIEAGILLRKKRLVWYSGLPFLFLA